MANGDGDKINIPKFDGTNFSLWKFRLNLLLEERSLLQFIESDLNSLKEKTKNDNEKDQLVVREAKCRSLIAQTVSDEQLTYIMDKPSAKEMYEGLLSVFQRKSITSQLVLRKQLALMKFDGDDMNKHFAKFDSIVRELRLAGAKPEESDLIVSLFLTLNEKYDALIESLNGMDESKLTLEYAKSRILDVFAKRNGGTKQTKSNDACAMQAKNPDIVCFKCGQKGHIKSRCRASKGKSSKQFSSKKGSSANCATKNDSNEHSILCAVRDRVGEKNEACCNGILLNAHTSEQIQALSSEKSDALEITFVMDSGATDDMCNDKKYFNNLVDIDGINISVAKKNEKITATEQGDILVKTFFDGDSETKKMQNVLYVRDLNCNLLSIRKLAKRGYKIVFEGDCATASKNGKTQFVAHAKGNLYEVTFHVDHDAFAGIAGEDNLMKFSQDLWHFRLGHLNVFDMKKLIDHGMVDGIGRIDVNTDNKFCEPCVLGKQTRLPFDKRGNIRSTRVLELLHTDVCGPISKPAYDGSLYFVSFTDDYTRASMIYCMKQKSEVFSKFKEYVDMAEAMHNCKVSKLRADNGGEYILNDFKAYCKSKGIRISYTVPYNPEMNGIAERLNRNLQEKALTMLLSSGVDRKFWNEAVYTANYIKNRCPTSAFGKQFVNKTPAELWHGKGPDISNIRIFGSVCYNHIPSEKRKKFEPKAKKCILMGYASNNSYRLWDVENNKLIIGRNVTFNEKSILNRVKLNSNSNSEAVIEFDSDCNEHDSSIEKENDLEFSNEDESSKYSTNLDRVGDIKDDCHSTNSDCTGDFKDKIHSTNLDCVGIDKGHGAKKGCTGNCKDKVNSANKDSIGNIDAPIRRSQRESKQPDRLGYLSNSSSVDVNFALSAQEYVENEPQSIDEARKRNDWHEWQQAIECEYDSLLKNSTWVLCDLPEKRKAISSKWVFKLKRKANGDIDKYKARLVAKGCGQKEGFDYTETYAPVAKLATLRILLAIAVQFKMHIHQMDVKSAFLNGDLNEDIYMLQPSGFTKGSKVCKLKKSIYGLKQASRMWNEKFNKFILRIGFKRSASDSCLYTKIEKGIRCYILLYVDDVLVVCDNLEMTEEIKRQLAAEFEMTDVGEVDTFLGMHIEYDRENGVMKLSQEQYLKNVVRKFGMEDCKSVATPIEKGLQLNAGDKSGDSKAPYRELIGCLTYATLTTRPDLCAATNYFSRFQSCYTNEHFTHAKRILRYVHGTTDLKLEYRRKEKAEVLVGYADSDWAGDANDCKSTSGFVFKLYGNTVTWSTHKQAVVSQSSTEAEYAAVVEAMNEAEWINELLRELNIETNEPITINEDNQSCIKVAEKQKNHRRMKHVAVKYHVVRDTIEKGLVKLKYIPTGEQIADIMTKGLGRIQFEKLRSYLNLV